MANEKDFLKENYSSSLSAAKDARAYVTLESSNADDDAEFTIYGNRLVAYLASRYRLHSNSIIEHGNLLEIGCGVGRLLKPLSCHFKWVTGVDISSEILDAARDYLRDTPNVSLIENDGKSLAEIPDSSIDFVLCTGVMQHIPYREVIAGYIEEAIRVLQLGGLFQFSFQVWQKEIIGHKRVGAKFTASWLNEVVKDLPVKLVEMTSDPADPLPHFTVILEKSNQPSQIDFEQFPVEHVAWRTTCWADLDSMQMHRDLESQGQREITFYD